jgi:hypothetical protein
MNDVLVLRSAIDLMDSETKLQWNNKHQLPPGYAWNEDGYVITAMPYPFLRACVGLRFAFLAGRLGMKEYIRQNMIVLRLLNPNVHKSIVGGVLFATFKKAGYILDRVVFDEVLAEVYQLIDIPNLDPVFITWRRTWFSETCEYDTISKILRVENSSKIDADRELMHIDEKYITAAVADFTGFSRRRIDSYWSEKQWDKQMRTLYTLEEAFTELSRQGNNAPTRAQLVEVSGLSDRTISRVVKDMERLLLENKGAKALSHNDNERCEIMTTVSM